ncbi:MAG: hypothetical protein ABR976_10020 [Terracidiphilus sp.]|jgi:hypothetical protein
MNLKPLAVFALATICFVPILHAQRSFWDSKNAYLRQPHPGDTPRIFAPGLLADPGTIVMDRIAFSLDGKEIYYYQTKEWSDLKDAKTKVFRYDGHKWNEPTVLNERFYALAFSTDGKTLYFSDENPHRVWMSKRANDEWSAPAIFIEKPYNLYDLMPTNSGAFYLGSDPDAEDKKNGIAFSFSKLTPSGNDFTVKSLGRPLNEPGFNGDFFIAPDESYMIVSAKETKTYECELYISFRKPDSTWTVPVSLGAKINDGLAHRWGQYVSPDGKYLFYTRATNSKDSAIYWVRFDKLLSKLEREQQ